MLMSLLRNALALTCLSCSVFPAVLFLSSSFRDIYKYALPLTFCHYSSFGFLCIMYVNELVRKCFSLTFWHCSFSGFLYIMYVNEFGRKCYAIKKYKLAMYQKESTLGHL